MADPDKVTCNHCYRLVGKAFATLICGLPYCASCMEIAKNRLETEENVKDTNPKDALGVAKVPLHTVSCAVLMEMGLGMMEGGRKYGTHNYRSMGVLASVYYDAAMRHLMEWWEGEDIDPDSGLSHITKALTTLSVLRDSMLMGNWKDDRPIQLPDGLNLADLNKKAAVIIEKYPDSKEPYTQVGQEVEGESFSSGEVVHTDEPVIFGEE